MSMKKNILWFIFITLILSSGIFLAVYFSWSEQITGTSFLLTDVVITEKKLVNSVWKVTLSSESDNPNDFEKYFTFPRTIDIYNNNYADIIVPGVRYQCVTIMIKIPYKDAKDKGFIIPKEDERYPEDLRKSRSNWIMLDTDKILYSVRDLQKYCFLTDLHAHDLDYYSEHYPYAP